MASKRTEITIETERTLVVERTNQRVRTDWCAACGAKTQLIALDEAAAALRISARVLLRWAAAARLHLNATPDRTVFICLDPLATERVINTELLASPPDESARAL